MSDDIRWLITILVVAAFSVFMGFMVGINRDDIKVTVEEPEVYENLLQELEAIEEIESFRIERTRMEYLVKWRLSVNLRDDVNFYFDEVEDFNQLYEYVDRVEYYISLYE